MAKKKESLTLEEKLEQAVVPHEEQPYEIPENWVWTKLCYVGDVKGGKRLPKGHSLLDDRTNHPYIRVTDFRDIYVELDSIKYISEETFTMISKYTITSDDIYVSIAGTIGKVGMIQENLNGANLTENAAKITNLNFIKSKYIMYLFLSENIQKQMKSLTKTTTQSKLALFRILDMIIPIPPLVEQQRIVNRIESLFEKLNRAKELAQNALDTFENRKSAILHKAFTGELTKKWREENDVSLDSWENKCLGELLLPMTSKKPSGEIFRYIDIDSIDNQNQVVREPKLLRVIEAPSRASRELCTNDIVFSMVRPYLKNIAYINEDLSDCIASTGFYVCRCKDKLIPKFLYNLLCSKDAIDYLMQYMKGDNSPSIRKADFESMPLYLPTLHEQTEIIRVIENILEKEQQAKELIDIIEKIDLIKKSILARAFRGELGTNNPDEESAIELLKECLLKED